MLKIYFILITISLTFGSVNYTFAQSLRHQTLSAMGGTNQVSSAELLVQQSIGQSSITGTFNTKSIYLSQGFLRGIDAPKKEIHPHFDVMAFPNAFDQHISFRFTTAHDELTQVLIYDSQGKKVYEQLHLPKNQEIEIELLHFAAGMYLVDISTSKRSTQVRILKNR